MARQVHANPSEGTASIVQLRATPKCAQERFGAATAGLLRLLSHERLPLTLTTDEEMEAAAILLRAGHVQATMELVPCPWGGFPRAAVVIGKITCSGLAR